MVIPDLPVISSSKWDQIKVIPLVRSILLDKTVDLTTKMHCMHCIRSPLSNYYAHDEILPRYPHHHYSLPRTRFTTHSAPALLSKFPSSNQATNPHPRSWGLIDFGSKRILTSGGDKHFKIHYM